MLGKNVTIDSKEYIRIGLTPIESLANFPLRILLFGHALMHQSPPRLPPPPGYSLDIALTATTHPSTAFASRAKAEAALLALKQAKGGELGADGGGSGEGASGGDSAGGKKDGGGGRKGGEKGGKKRGKDLYPQNQFDLVLAWWGGGQSLPIRYELVTVRSSLLRQAYQTWLSRSLQTRDSPTSSDRVPTIVMDQLLSKNGSLLVAKSTSLDLVFKEVCRDDDAVDELLNERACFEQLYKNDDAGDFLVGYIGFYKSNTGSYYCLVTEAAEEVDDWRSERCLPSFPACALSQSNRDLFAGTQLSPSSSSSTSTASFTATWPHATSSRRLLDSASSIWDAQGKRKKTIVRVRWNNSSESWPGRRRRWTTSGSATALGSFRCPCSSSPSRIP